MVDSNKIVVEFTIREAQIMARAIASNSPPKEDEMISFMLYGRIVRKLEDATGKHEPL